MGEEKQKTTSGDRSTSRENQYFMNGGEPNHFESNSIMAQNTLGL